MERPNGDPVHATASLYANSVFNFLQNLSAAATQLGTQLQSLQKGREFCCGVQRVLLPHPALVV